MATTLEHITIEHFDFGAGVTLPRDDSKLYRCLVQLVALETANTREIADNLNLRGKGVQTVSEVASQLTVLRIKGLAVTIIDRKGVAGGSTWEPTPTALKLLGRSEGCP